jgi:DNA-binding SARP family transcriptional activator
LDFGNEGRFLPTGRDSLLRLTPTTAEARLSLLGSFELVCAGARVRLPLSSQRLVAFLALHDRPLRRLYVAGVLWLDTPEQRAYANLRSALWRLHRCDPGLVDAAGQELRLSPKVVVDIREAEAAAHRILEVGEPGEKRFEPAQLIDDLLPDWYDDWVLLERERFRQVRLHALDNLCERLTTAGRLEEALEAGLFAVAAEPLRESAHRALVRIHLAEGNTAEAIRQYRLCRRLLKEQLGVEPSPQMQQLFQEVHVLETIR